MRARVGQERSKLTFLLIAFLLLGVQSIAVQACACGVIRTGPDARELNGALWF